MAETPTYLAITGPPCGPYKLVRVDKIPSDPGYSAPREGGIRLARIAKDPDPLQYARTCAGDNCTDYRKRVSEIDYSLIYRFDTGTGSVCTYFDPDEVAPKDHCGGASSEELDTFATCEECEDETGDVCGTAEICPGGLPSMLTVTGTMDVRPAGGGSIIASCNFSVTAAQLSPEECDWVGDSTDCIGVGGSDGVGVGEIAGGIDGFGGGIWGFSLTSDADYHFLKCGLSPIGSYDRQGGVSEWIAADTIEVRYTNVVVS